MCEFCEENKPIFEFEMMSESVAVMAPDTKASELIKITDNMIVFIDDRGYIRLVDEDEQGCLDHGITRKLNSCPFCGNVFDHSPTKEG